MFLRSIITILAASLGMCAHAQHRIQGRVVDARTSEPLAFVHLAVEATHSGVQSDIDGLFTIEVPALPATLRTSYVGYATTTHMVTDAGPQLIRLQRQTHELAAVDVLPTENPAHRIIKQVYANRKTNDGMRNRSHRYTSYSKTIFTAEVDSARKGTRDTEAAADTSDSDVTFFEDQHLLLIESATKRSFIPPAAEKEEVIAMRVSGLKDPSLLALAASTKTFSIYAPQIVLNEKTYVGPIGQGSTNQYLFLIEDTLYKGADTVFVISYQPRRGKKFDALKGVLYVNTDGYALQNVIAEPVERDGLMSLRLQQQHEKVQGRAWFPVQLNTFIYFDGMVVGDKRVVGIGRTYLKEIEVDADVARREVRGAEFEMQREAVRRDEAFWSGLRNDSLDAKELRTYHVIDSIGEEVDLDRKLKWFSYLATGRVPMGPVDLRLQDLLAFNGYEGVRLGMSLATNDRITRHASLGGYLAHGFGDGGWKYGGDLTIKPRPGRDVALRLLFADDVDESGGVAFPGFRTPSFGEGYRLYYMDRMERIRRYQAQLAFRVNSSLKVWLGTERADRENQLGYRYARPLTSDATLLANTFRTGSVSLGLRFAFREQLVRLPDREVTLGSRWPVLHVMASRAVDGLWQGQYDIWRVSAQLDKTFHIRMLGHLSWRVMGGMADTKAPYPFLFNLRGTWNDGFPLAANNSFEVMRPNEFTADRYVAVHMRHHFGNLLYKGKGKFKPEPVLVGSAVWGRLEHGERHHGYAVQAPEEGYYEAGLQIENVLNLGLMRLGVGAFQRMGREAFPEPVDNLTVKLVLGFAVPGT
jgi:hypothetical protein